MENRNPYASPRASVADPEGDQEYGEIRVLSAAGRLGRIRYIGYSAGLTLLIMLVLGVLAGAASLAGVGGASAVQALVIVGYLALVVVQILLTIQRAHDFNSSGWLSVLMFVPLVNLVFWFIPGTPGENQFGRRPPPNTVGAIVLACSMPLTAIVGMLAAIAIPAYQDYTIRAQVSEGLNLAAAPKAAVAEVLGRDGVVPIDRAAAGLSAAAADTRGKYVASVDVVNGTVVVTYGGEANSAIAGRVLAIEPYLTVDKSVGWRCGYGASPTSRASSMRADTLPAGDATDIDPRFLPSACRPGAR